MIPLALLPHLLVLPPGETRRSGGRPGCLQSCLLEQVSPACSMNPHFRFRAPHRSSGSRARVRPASPRPAGPVGLSQCPHVGWGTRSLRIISSLDEDYGIYARSRTSSSFRLLPLSARSPGILQAA
eukprot:6247886-Heterocapsa_arctica.AAC.1